LTLKTDSGFILHNRILIGRFHDEMMKSVIILSLPVLLLLLAPAAYATPFAGSNRMARGAFSESLTLTGSTIVGNGVLVTDTMVTKFSGDMVGVAVFSVSETLYLNGSNTFNATGIFAGRTLGSAPGTYRETYSGTGVGATFQGHGEDSNGTLGFAGIIGAESFSGMYTSGTTATGTYTLLAHF
jgi:hypothetical protein